VASGRLSSHDCLPHKTVELGGDSTISCWEGIDESFDVAALLVFFHERGSGGR